jgi:hypothetical protein
MAAAFVSLHATSPNMNVISDARVGCRALHHGNTDFAETFSVRVAVTHAFPFLVTKLRSYFDGYPETIGKEK